MMWLYRLQQRLSMTRREGLAILTLAGLFLVGLGVRHYQKQQVPPLGVDSLVARSPADSIDSGSTQPTSSPPPSAEHPINVNTASQTVLQKLPGVGPVLAKRIATYRSNQGPFEQVDALQKVSGIGPKTLATLRPMIRISAPSDTTE